jgi:hypothetical protein
MPTELSSITISNEYDSDGDLKEESYVASLTGLASELFSITDEYFESEVDAEEFAREVSLSTGDSIIWNV